MQKVTSCLWFDPEGEEAAEAMLGMKKIEVAELERAAAEG